MTCFGVFFASLTNIFWGCRAVWDQHACLLANIQTQCQGLPSQTGDSVARQTLPVCHLLPLIDTLISVANEPISSLCLLWWLELPSASWMKIHAHILPFSSISSFTAAWMNFPGCLACAIPVSPLCLAAIGYLMEQRCCGIQTQADAMVTWYDKGSGLQQLKTRKVYFPLSMRAPSRRGLPLRLAICGLQVVELDERCCTRQAALFCLGSRHFCQQ